MTTLLPTSQSTGVEAYEDMFKEITRKLYGDESAHGLYPHNTQVAQLAPGAPTAPPDGGERSFTTLTQIGYETTTVGSSSAAGPESAGAPGASAASTAFGLAALMQNGFPPPGAILNPVNFPPGTSKTPTNISTPSGDTNRWHGQQQAAEQESWNTGKHSSSTYGGKSSYKKPKTEPQDAGLNIPSTADRTGKGGAQGGGGGAGSSSSSSGTTPHAYKRYSCTTCPYTTDRRDLFTRHENIHKDEKPFQCYACLKPFNRADHVKKHFLRMHRELEYDIAKTRRCPPSTSGTSGSGTSGSSSANTNKASSNYYGHMSSQSGNSGALATSTETSATTSTTQQPMQLNIPSGSFTNSGAHSLNIPSHAHEGVGGQHHITTSGLNGGHSAGQLLQLHNLHHQQQQQHNVHHSSITIKQEKGLASGGSSLNTSASSAGGSPDEKSFVKKIKGEKKFACTFCPWAGTDNWGLKRHLNTHTKPYVCLLCDYKAARSERLATHVLKVHNKKACGKCSFFAEDQAHLDAHLQEAHLLHMQAVGRNKASVTQDFHNAGGGDNGINGDHSSSDGGSPHPSTTAALPLLVGSKADRMRNDPQMDGGKSAAPTLAKATDNVALSLASLLGGDQLSFLQLLATAAVAHQQLQLHSSTGPYAHTGGSSSSSGSVQQKKQQQPKPSKAATAATVYQPSPVAGASKGDRYGSMVSSPPATANTLPHPQPHPRPATTANSTSSSKHSSNSTNGTTIIIPIGAPTTTAGPGTTSTIGSSPTPSFATGESAVGGYKKRRLNGSSSSDKENLIHRKGHTGSTHHHLPGAPSDIIVNGGNGIVNGGGSKIGHNHHHNHHHHNNNNSSTSNKNINDIFDKVYKKPQNSFAPSSTKQGQHGVLPPILRIAPPAAVEDDTVNPPVVIETEGQQFSLTEFLKNHTEVSISTVGNGTTGCKAGDDEEDSGVSSSELEASEKLPPSIQVVPPKKRKSEGERNPRKQQQPRRFDDSDSGGDVLPLDLAPGEKPVINITPAEETMSEGKKKASSPELPETGSSDESSSCGSRLADIRDKHMTRLVSRRRCCRICQNRGLLDHLDNYHYHSKISLILHMRWRHSRNPPQEVRCRQCGSQFRQAYKLALHRRLTHHTSSAEGRKRTVLKKSNGTAPGVGKRSNGKENLATNCTSSHLAVKEKSSPEHKKEGSARKKQRRRKPRSRCFTPRRRK